MAHAALAPAWEYPARRGLGQIAFCDVFTRTPLIPLAITFSGGIIADRLFEISLRDSLIASFAALAAWSIAMLGQQRGLAILYLCGGVLGLGAAYHNWHIHGLSANDISNFAPLEPTPVVVRGVLYSEPVLVRPAKSHPLQTFPSTALTRVTLRVTQLQQPDGWRPVSGLTLVNVGDRISDVHVGDVVEVAGRLHAPDQPDNPGQFEYASFLRDQRIGAVLSVQKTAQGMVRLEERWPTSPAGWLAVVRAWGQEVIASSTPETKGVATALLLGEGSVMTGDEWEKYYRTGVLHVLAISGQHLVVLAAFFWFGLRLLGVSQRRGAVMVAVLLLTYSLLAGGRPPVLRAAVMVVAWCVALFLRRPVVLANIFALAWLIVALLNPTDIFNAGCQLSFLSVAVLCWGAGRWLYREANPLDRLIDESRSTLGRLVVGIGRTLWKYYALTLITWLAIAPLVAARYHIVSPVALLIGPPLILLTSVALIAGFLLLLLSPLGGPAAWLLASTTELSLQSADLIVNGAICVPGGFFYVPDLPQWWVLGFYGGLIIGLTLPWRTERWLLVAGATWLVVLIGIFALRSAEFRCTFLAVGHGGCTVIETPDGRTILYDAGAMAGPEVTRRSIAPYLWRRGIRRIDELVISHADLDHFNGLPALLERFSVGEILCTPSFSDRSIPGVRLTLDAIQRHGIPVRIVKAGDQLNVGTVKFDVLHPPERGPEGKENARSLVMRMTYAEYSVLLTGDLEEPGLKMVLRLPRATTDVLLAPHHGSKASNTHEFAQWANPTLVVSSQGSWFGKSETPEPYKKIGATFVGTWPEGAITLRLENNELVAESFKTKKRLNLSAKR